MEVALCPTRPRCHAYVPMHQIHERAVLRGGPLFVLAPHLPARVSASPLKRKEVVPEANGGAWIATGELATDSAPIAKPGRSASPSRAAAHRPPSAAARRLSVPSLV